MQKPQSFLTLALTALVLAGCTPASTTPPPPTPAPGGSAETFKGTGTVDLASATGAVPINTLFGNASKTQSFVVGTLNSDKTVNIAIDSAVLKGVPTRNLANDKTTSACNTSGITATDTNYLKFGIITFTTTDGKKFGAQMGTKVTDATGLQRQTTYEYWYTTASGTYQGKTLCTLSGSTRTITYNVTLAAGWNRIKTSAEFNTVTRTWGDSAIASEGVSNTFDGPWTSYSLN